MTTFPSPRERSLLIAVGLAASTSAPALAQDGFTFTALTPLDGVIAHELLSGHVVHDSLNGLPGVTRAHYELSSLDWLHGVDPTVFPGPADAKAALRVTATGSDLAQFDAALSASLYAGDPLTVRFGTIDLGPDVLGSEYYVGGDTETRLYGPSAAQAYTFYLGGEPLITGPMPIVEMSIDYNDALDQLDDQVALVSQYTSAADATTVASPPGYPGLAAALLADIGDRGLRFRYENIAANTLAFGVAQSGLLITSTEGYVDLSPSPFDAGASSVAPASGTANACQSAVGSVNSTGSGAWLHLVDASGHRLASVLDDEALGAITAEVYVNGAAVRGDADGREWLDRNVVVTPAAQPANPVRVRLYFTDGEWSAYLAANDGDASDGRTVRELWVRKFASDVCAGTPTGAYDDLRVLDHGRVDGGYYAEIEVTSFSDFYMGGDGESGEPLPVTWTSVAAERRGTGGVTVRWSTAAEFGAADYVVERSVDGRDFRSVGTVPARGRGAAYRFDDVSAPRSSCYYRLRQRDRDGAEALSVVVATDARGDSGGSASLVLAPNPVAAGATVGLRADGATADLEVLDLAGAVVARYPAATASLPTAGLRPGSYVVRSGGRTARLVVR